MLNQPSPDICGKQKHEEAEERGRKKGMLRTKENIKFCDILNDTSPIK